jgi:hypothetical protein
MFERLKKPVFWSAVAAIVFFLLAGVVQQSETFAECVKSHRNTKDYQQLHERIGILGGAVIRMSTRVRLNYVCAWDFASNNNGAIFAAALTVVSLLQWRVYRRQAEILEETRDIVLAGLDRPYVLVDSASYRFEPVGTGRLLLNFDFSLQNYGKSPAIIDRIVAYGFLSRGPGSIDRAEYPAIEFPTQDHREMFLGDGPKVRVFPEVRPDVINLRPIEMGFRHKKSILILTPQAPSPTFTHFAGDASPINESDKWLKSMDSSYTSIRPWLIGEITYLSVFGKKHHTNFCFRGRSDGVAEEDCGPPYNERT